MRFACISFLRVETVLDFGCFQSNDLCRVSFRFVSPRRVAKTCERRAREREIEDTGGYDACMRCVGRGIDKAESVCVSLVSVSVSFVVRLDFGI